MNKNKFNIDLENNFYLLLNLNITSKKISFNKEKKLNKFDWYINIIYKSFK